MSSVKSLVLGLLAAHSASSLPNYGLFAEQDGKFGAVASESALCSDIGASLLKQGGNAADAMVGTVLCVGTVGMYHSGIGGGGFMIVRSPNGSYEDIDFRETAPAAAFQDMFNANPDASIRSGLASGVPGEIRGLEYLHKKYGKLPWADVFAPVIDVARNGWYVSYDLVRYIDRVIAQNGDFFTTDPIWAMDFAPNGTLLGYGDIIKRQRYADTLEAIAREGADAFYTGDIAKATVHALQRANGTMTLEDLANYTIVTRKPVQVNYRGYKLTSCGAPASGAIALSVMKAVEGYDDFGDPAVLNLSTHRLDEAIRFGYGWRTEFGDPSFIENVTTLQDYILTDEAAAATRAKISDFYTRNVSDYNPRGFESLDTPGTSEIATADHTGLAISLTTTVNLLFGSQLMVPETGIIMNNEMNDFSIPNSSDAFGYIPSPANYIRPFKRPLSSITPTIVEDSAGRLYYVTGAGGGSRIITSTLQSLWNVLDRNMTVHQALKQPRLHDQLTPNTVTFEYSYDNSTVEFMKEKGHNVSWVAPGQSSVHAILRQKDGRFEAAAEPRLVASGGATCCSPGSPFWRVLVNNWNS